MEFPYKVNSMSEEETTRIAVDFAEELKGGDIVALIGGLGAGKTYFIKAAAKFFNIGNVNSPSFAIVNEYYGASKIFHFDFYRINNISELYEIGLNDYFNEPTAIIFIEWADMFPEALPHKRFEVSIKVNKDFSRQFKFAKIK